MRRKATLNPAHDEIVIVSAGPTGGKGGVTSGFAIATRSLRDLVQFHPVSQSLPRAADRHGM